MMHVVRPPKSLRLVIVLIWERLAGFSDNPGFGVRGSRCGVRDTGFGLRDLGCGIRDSGFAIRDSGCEIDSTDRSDLSCERVRPHPISNPQSPIRNPQSAIKKPPKRLITVRGVDSWSYGSCATNGLGSPGTTSRHPIPARPYASPKVPEDTDRTGRCTARPWANTALDKSAPSSLDRPRN